VKAKPGETIIFAWVVFKSRAHRDRVNQKVMKDPRIAKMDPASMPVDAKRMSYGGFTTIVSLGELSAPSFQLYQLKPRTKADS
jgi:uncharacterized protein YbaA (DUF1428 family)